MVGHHRTGSHAPGEKVLGQFKVRQPEELVWV
jgi:hypothetical protein